MLSPVWSKSQATLQGLDSACILFMKEKKKEKKKDPLMSRVLQFVQHEL